MSVIAPDGTIWPAGSLRAIEHSSIRAFVAQAARDGYLKGRVLDYGCGTAPYREIVEAYGEWFGYDRAAFPDNHVGDVGDDDLTIWPDDPYDAVLMTQVIQYIPIARHDGHTTLIPHLFAYMSAELLRDGGHLVLTYPTNWPEAQPEDLFRFTANGIERLLTDAGFTIVHHERQRAYIRWKEATFSLGGGVIARA